METGVLDSLITLEQASSTSAQFKPLLLCHCEVLCVMVEIASGKGVCVYCVSVEIVS